jgi:hypothetical protein
MTRFPLRFAAVLVGLGLLGSTGTASAQFRGRMAPMVHAQMPMNNFRMTPMVNVQSQMSPLRMPSTVAAQSQLNNFRAAVNPNFFIAPGLTLRQAAFNTAVLGRAISTIPPYAMGYNPYPSMVNYGPIVPMTTPAYNPGVFNPALYSMNAYNPYPYNPYLSSGFGSTYIPGVTMNPYMP